MTVLQGSPYPGRVHVTSDLGAVAAAVRRARPTGAAGTALGAALAVASVVLVTQGRVLLHQCVVADGPLASLGVRLALLRSAAECPDGTLGLGSASQGAVLLLSVTAPLVAAHLLLAACGLGLGTVVRRGVAVAVLLLQRLLPAVPGPGTVVLPARVAVPAVGASLPLRGVGGHDPARPRRGPPVH